MVLNAVMCGSYALFRCIQQTLRREREARMQGAHVAPANDNVHPQGDGADANTGDADGAHSGAVEDQIAHAANAPAIRMR